MVQWMKTNESEWEWFWFHNKTKYAIYNKIYSAI